MLLRVHVPPKVIMCNVLAEFAGSSIDYIGTLCTEAHFIKTLPMSSALIINQISVRFYEMDCTYMNIK